MFRFIKNLVRKAVSFVKNVVNSIAEMAVKSFMALKSLFMPRVGDNHKAEELNAVPVI